MNQVAEEYRRRGHRPYVLPSSFHPLGAIAYVDCARELAEQLDRRGIHANHVYLTSAGATQVGLALGARHLQCTFRVTGINHSPSTAHLTDRLLALAADTAARLGIATRLDAADLPNDAAFVGSGYGVPTADGVQVIGRLARTEGIFLDPVYTAKGMAGLIAHVRSGRIRSGETVVFVHTGGLPNLFAFGAEMLRLAGASGPPA
jgi:1-aminocyclopropane-1-carboxylate deaminase/D-cysteine desulfhydrase-like pyridoxal-dependent ACC family enzyme